MNTAVLSTVLTRSSSPRSDALLGSPTHRIPDAVRAEQAPARPLAPTAASHSPARVAVLRTVLLVGCAVAAAVTWAITSGAARPADAELAVLLRGMAAIKLALALLAAAVAAWRFGLPVSTGAVVGYMGCVWLLFIGSMLIWQLAFLVAAALLYHLGSFVALLIAWREGGLPLRRIAGHAASMPKPA